MSGSEGKISQYAVRKVQEEGDAKASVVDGVWIRWRGGGQETRDLNRRIAVYSRRRAQQRGKVERCTRGLVSEDLYLHY